MRRHAIALLTIGFLGACAAKSGGANGLGAATQSMVGVWAGSVPSLHETMRLTLNADHTADFYDRMPSGQSDDPEKWEVDDNKLMLSNGFGSEVYWIKGNVLVTRTGERLKHVLSSAPTP